MFSDIVKAQWQLFALIFFFLALFAEGGHEGVGFLIGNYLVHLLASLSRGTQASPNPAFSHTGEGKERQIKQMLLT